MNFERADASYTAWDQRILAKSRHKGVPVRSNVETPATIPPREGPQSGNIGSANRTFRSTLAYAADHEHEMDPTWRSAAAASNSKSVNGGGEDESFGFWDFVDIVNPLQHIPLVATLYRDITGDEISAPARIMGGALYGGPLGFAASVGNAIMEEATGKDFGDTALAMILDESREDVAPAEDTTLALNDAATGGSVQLSASVNVGNSQAKTDTPLNSATTVLENEVGASSMSTELSASRERAEPKAIAQMTANNAALQALLKDLGLTQGAQPSSSPPAATAGAQETAKRHEMLASAPSTAPGTSPSMHQDRPNAIALNRKLDQQPGAEGQRKSIPIEPGRFMSSRGADRSTIPARTSQPATFADTVRQSGEAQAPLPSRATGGGSDDTGRDTTPLQASFADRMLEALDRYQAMSKQTGANDDSSLEQLGTDNPGAI